MLFLLGCLTESSFCQMRTATKYQAVMVWLSVLHGMPSLLVSFHLTVITTLQLYDFRLFDRVKFLSDANRYVVSSSDGMALRLTWNAFIAGQ